MDAVEHNIQYPLKHIYPTRITKLSQDSNQVESAAPAATRHQHWLMNINEKVKTTIQLIENYLR